MNRTLSITLDDEAKTIDVENHRQFSTIELLGLSKYLEIQATLIVVHKARGDDPVEVVRGAVRAEMTATLEEAVRQMREMLGMPQGSEGKAE